MRNWTQADFLTPDLVELSARAAGWFEALRNQICSQLKLLNVMQKIVRSLINLLVVLSAELDT